jgi:hypothetical protein
MDSFPIDFQLKMRLVCGQTRAQHELGTGSSTATLVSHHPLSLVLEGAVAAAEAAIAAAMFSMAAAAGAAVSRAAATFSTKTTSR